MPESTVENDLNLEEEQQEETVAVNYEIASYPSDYTLSVIDQMYKDGDIVIPSYQRGFVWTIKQASLLIDSFLCSLPVPPVFFYIDKDNKKVVIDGNNESKASRTTLRDISAKQPLPTNETYFGCRASVSNPRTTTRQSMSWTSLHAENLSRPFCALSIYSNLNPKTRAPARITFLNALTLVVLSCSLRKFATVSFAANSTKV